MACPPITTHIDRASFNIWSKDDIKKISVKKLTEPKSFEKLGAVHPEGLYSNALGPIKRFEICTTCGLTDLHCPGHYGHIELSVPVYHPMLVQTMFQILSKSCLACFHFRLSPQDLTLFLAQLEALNNGFEHLVDDLDSIAKDICRGEKNTDLYLNVLLKDKLKKMIEDEKEKTLNFECQKRPQQRSIVERLSKLFRNFINGHLIKPLKLCPKCGEKKVTMSLHQQSVVVMGTGASKPINELGSSGTKSTAAKRKKKKVESGLIKCDDLRVLKTDEKKFLTPIGVRSIFRKLWMHEKHTMKQIFHFLNIVDQEIKREEDEGQIDEDVDDIDRDDDPKKKLEFEEKFQPVDLFFIDTILVPPAKFRPPMSQRGFSFEGPRTAALGNVMKQSVILQDCIGQMVSETDEVEAEQLQPKLQGYWKELQVSVNSLYDNEMDKYGKNKYPGLKQLIDKKEGLFRKNMMGKRVNFAARSVISPDPNISVDQVGVPLVFAKKLTYPQPVTPWNIQQLREAVLNGPDKYPGALSIVFEDGVTVSLTKESVRQNIASRLSYNPRHNPRTQKVQADTPMVTIVNRHLLTGDVLLFNRQPTLHKCSIMAFRARVLPNEKGFRLHYANCKSFNADFDGDEMNAHLPQSELARSEAYNIASVNHQYLVPKDGSPLGGLIQDHVVAVCILTRRDQLLDKEKYHQLVFCALSFLDRQLKLEPPTIMKPEPIWTGKQVITTIIKNCVPAGKLPPTLKIKSKIGPKILNIRPEYEKLSDCHVYIKDGELLTGFMDKSNVGATQYGLVHLCYELYGGETSSNMMSAFARLSTWYLQLYEGFTLGIGDILIETDADEERRRLIEDSRLVGPESAKEALGLKDDYIEDHKLEDKLREAHSDRDPLPMKKLDASMKKRTDKCSSAISSRCLPEGLIRRFPDNNLQMMIQSGAKGGTVNALQISCLLGQIELEGRRVPLSMSGRTLPSFRPYDTSPKAGGFVSGRFLTGIQPQEFFFHCMAGREGLIDTAVKTSRSGYLQRCLIKHLEGLTVQYDQTVRDSCGSVIQFLYGEDGLDIVKCQMLKENAFPLLVDNFQIIGPGEDELKQLNKAKESYEDDLIAHSENIQQWLDQNGENRIRKIRGSGFLDFQASMLNDLPPDDPSPVLSFEHKELDHLQRQQECHSISIKEEKDVKCLVKGEKNDDDDDDVVFCSQISAASKQKIREAWYELSFKEKRKWNRFWDSCPDPLTALLNPGSHFGVVPEKLDERIENFVKKHPHLIVNPATLIGGDDDALQDSYIDCDINPELSKTLFNLWTQTPGLHLKPKLTKHEFYNLAYNLYMKMLAQPGEAVGLLAAQSIGEPSTQMTLNTFHFAGRGEMNVTLGIPRLREILMTASAKIGTPSMDLPLLPVLKDDNGRELNAEDTEAEAQRVKLALNAVRLSDVLEYVDVTEQVVDVQAEESFQGRGRKSYGSGRKNTRKQAKGASSSTTESATKSIDYKLHFRLLPSRYYKHEFRTRTTRVLEFIEKEFISQLIDTMLKRMKRLQVAESIFDMSTRRMNKERGAGAGGAGKGATDGEGGGGDVEERELDDYNAKQRAKEKMKEDESSSEDDEDGEGDNTTQRMKNRRNPELDYEEAEDDDLQVADLDDAKAAEQEEGDHAILNDDADDGADDSFTQTDDATIQQQQQAPKQQPAGGEEMHKNGADDDDEDDRDNAYDEDRGPVGKTLELAGFEDANTRSGYASPTNGGGGDGDDGEDGETKSGQQNTTEASVKKKLKEKLPQGPDEVRAERVMCIQHVTDYTYDYKPNPRWCEVTIRLGLATTRLDMGALIESEAKRTFVHRVGNISRALIVKDVGAKERGAKCDKMIKTEGVSLLSLVKFNHILDLNAIYSNDIHAIARTYGIEAASQAIRREMANVFAVYGIEVDSRHLSLIADYMTYNGSIRGMNRMSMEASASPFQQMSFESTIRYLKFAAILGLCDDIRSPSAALVFGRPTRGGTGLFSTLVDCKSQAVVQVPGGGNEHYRPGRKRGVRRSASVQQQPAEQEQQPELGEQQTGAADDEDWGAW